MKPTERRKFDLVVIGELNPDLILRGNAVPEFGQVEKIVEEAELTIGSSAAIFACGAARLGLRVAFIGKVGGDEFGDFMLRSLNQRGIDTHGVIRDGKLRTGFSIILVDKGDRAILTFAGAIPELRLEEISPSLLAEGRHLHLTSYFLQCALRPDVPRLFDMAHEAGMTVSLDTNFDPTEEWDGGLHRALEKTDIFLPNEVECRAIAGADDISQAVERLAGKVGTLAVKLGSQGALARRGKETAQSGAMAVGVVDTVGAGDSFDAGFVYGALAGWSLEKSLQLGVACGSLSTRAAGGTAAQPTLEEAAGYLKNG
jgi:sugar/nucleoside kinase (ribokinase family)